MPGRAAEALMEAAHQLCPLQLFSRKGKKALSAGQLCLEMMPGRAAEALMEAHQLCPLQLLLKKGEKGSQRWPHVTQSVAWTQGKITPEQHPCCTPHSNLMAFPLYMCYAATTLLIAQAGVAMGLVGTAVGTRR